MELKPGYGDAYHNRGRAYDLQGQYLKAIADFTLAIEASPEDAEAYNARGVSWDNLREYDKAIADYNKAIELNPGYIDAYNNLGETMRQLKQYDRALALYAKGIELDPDYPLPYINRGAIYEDLQQPEKAMAEYRKALEVKSDYPYAYARIGTMLSKQGNHKEALAYFELAHQYAPHSKYFKKLLDDEIAKGGEAVTVQEEAVRFSAHYVEKEILHLPEHEKPAIRKACAAINEQVELIRKLIVYKGSAPVVHYTNLNTADIVIMNPEARLRYSNVVFMNDPEEGKVLLDFFLDTPLKHAFEKGTMEEDNNIYLGSFLPEDKADYLVMWRTYGKNELKEEAAGCSITFKRAFFDSEDSGLHVDMRFGETDPTDRQALYHVLYYDKEKCTLVSDTMPEMVEDVNRHMKELQKELAALLLLKDKSDICDEGKKNAAINKFVYRYVSELRYFFKSADYQFEKELRVIKYYLPKDAAVKVETSINRLPRRLYIESTNLVRANIAKIILGPKVAHPERWMYLDAVMAQGGYNMDLEFSRCKFQ